MASSPRRARLNIDETASRCSLGDNDALEALIAPIDISRWRTRLLAMAGCVLAVLRQNHDDTLSHYFDGDRSISAPIMARQTHDYALKCIDAEFIFRRFIVCARRDMRRIGHRHGHRAESEPIGDYRPWRRRAAMEAAQR